MRRLGYLSSGYVSSPSTWDIADADLYSWWRGDDPGATTGGDPETYSAIPDGGSLEGSWVQADEELRPDVSNEFSTGPSPYFHSGRRLVHSSSAATWDWMTDGVTDADFFVGIYLESLPNFGRLFSTRTSGSAIGQSMLIMSNGAVRMEHLATDTLHVPQSAAGVVSTGSYQRLRITKRGPTWSIFGGNGALALTSTFTDVSAETPAGALTIGASVTGGSPMDGIVTEFAIIRPANESALPYYVSQYLRRWK